MPPSSAVSYDTLLYGGAGEGPLDKERERIRSYYVRNNRDGVTICDATIRFRDRNGNSVVTNCDDRVRNGNSVLANCEDRVPPLLQIHVHTPLMEYLLGVPATAMFVSAFCKNMG